MGRPIPSSQAISLPLSLPLFAASIAASVAIFITLCISHQRKSSRSPKSQPSSPKREQKSRSLHSSTSDKSTKKIKTSTESIPTSSPSPPAPPRPIEDQEQSRQPPPLVLDEAMHGAIAPISPVNASTSSRRRLSASLSMRLTEGLSRIRTSNKKKVEEEEMPAEEQSVWMKTIILGERCKVPSDDEEVVIKDEKGNKKRNYHPKTPRSLPVSRTNSFVTT